MKAIILTLIGLGFCVQAKSANLSTVDGAIYNNITVQRAEPDGLYIEYTPPGGGLGMSKVKFSRLSQDQQKHFGFDSTKAKDYEVQVAKATEDYRQECVRREQAAQTQKAAQQARADQEERTFNDRIMAMAQLKSAEADLARATGGNGNYGWSSLGGGDGLFAIPQVGGRVPRARTDYAPVVTPIPFPQVNTPRSTR